MGEVGTNTDEEDQERVNGGRHNVRTRIGREIICPGIQREGKILWKGGNKGKTRCLRMFEDIRDIFG